jgi:hypothetical protein
MIDDLFYISLYAQTKYVGPRIFNDKKRNEFFDAMQAVLEILKTGSYSTQYTIHYDTPGGEIAREMVIETGKNLTERFIDGRSGDAMLEKL